MSEEDGVSRSALCVRGTAVAGATARPDTPTTHRKWNTVTFEIQTLAGQRGFAHLEPRCKPQVLGYVVRVEFSELHNTFVSLSHTLLYSLCAG